MCTPLLAKESEYSCAEVLGWQHLKLLDGVESLRRLAEVYVDIALLSHDGVHVLVGECPCRVLSGHVPRPAPSDRGRHKSQELSLTYIRCYLGFLAMDLGVSIEIYDDCQCPDGDCQCHSREKGEEGKRGRGALLVIANPGYHDSDTTYAAGETSHFTVMSVQHLIMYLRSHTLPLAAIS